MHPWIHDDGRDRVTLLEEALNEAAQVNAELQSRDALKTQFLANISHDLRTPLTAIITHAEILRDGILGPLSEQQRDSVREHHRRRAAAARAVGEILTYARGAANQLTVSPSEFHIAAVVGRSRAQRAVRREEGLSLRVDVAPAFRRSSPTARRSRTSSATCSATRSSSRRRAVVCGCARDVAATATAQCRWKSATRGIGIAPEHHDLVFREFAQVDPRRRGGITARGWA